MISLDYFNIITENLIPVESVDNITWWSSTYFMDGNLMRYSSVKGSQWVEVTAMLSEEMISR